MLESTQRQTMENPPHIMQKFNTTYDSSQVYFCFNFNGKIGTIKANTRHTCSALHMQTSALPSDRVRHLLLFLGECAYSLRALQTWCLNMWFLRLKRGPSACHRVPYELVSMSLSIAKHSDHMVLSQAVCALFSTVRGQSLLIQGIGQL